MQPLFKSTVKETERVLRSFLIDEADDEALAKLSFQSKESKSHIVRLALKEYLSKNCVE